METIQSSELNNIKKNKSLISYLRPFHSAPTPGRRPFHPGRARLAQRFLKSDKLIAFDVFPFLKFLKLSSNVANVLFEIRNTRPAIEFFERIFD
jgi:hypothetical protein